MHSIKDKKEDDFFVKSKKIYFGEHVWVGCNSTILKGTTTARDCVIGAGSVCCGKLTQPNSVFAGNPAQLIKNNIEWKV